MRETASRTTRRTSPEGLRLGERLRQRRVAAGLTQSELAGDRFSKEYVSQIERGKTRPTEGTIEWLADRLGVGYGHVRAVNPSIIYCSVSGYGQTGDLTALPGHDVNYQAWAGALSPEGAPAFMPVLPTADLASGMAAAFGICAALFGGEGAHLDISMTDVMATWTGDASSMDPSSLSTRLAC